jgi:hypothetical protein
MNNPTNIKIISEQESETNQEKKTNQESNSDNLNEKYLDSKFVGYYLDLPSSPVLTDYLGEVDNPVKCILKGKESNYKYIGLQKKTQCFGTNVLPNNLKEIPRIKTNKLDKKIDGFYYNQIYTTSNQEKLIKPDDMISKYKDINNELYQINQNINQNNFVEEKPLNPYVLILWLIIIVIVIYLIVEYINKKESNQNVI